MDLLIKTMGKHKYSKDELLFNLPDYIAGKIIDSHLINEIETELISDPQFKSEYELLKNAFSEIKGLNFSEPPEHYFSGLIPEINKRLESKNEQSVFAHFFRISNLMKYALPVLSVLLVIIIINYSNKNSKDRNMFTQSDHTINNIMNNKDTGISDSSGNLKIQNEDDKSNAENIENTENTGSVKTKETSLIKNNIETSTQEKVTETNNSNLIELLTESEDSDDEYYYESDFNNLSQNEQNDLLNKLSNTKF